MDNQQEEHMEINEDYGDFTKCPDCNEYTIKEEVQSIGSNDYARCWTCTKCGSCFSE